jgi:hypothetical protein
MPVGHIRGLGRSQHKVDGLEPMEIWVNKKYALPLPFHDGLRIPIRLRVGTAYYDAGLRATSRNAYVWICPNLLDSQRQKISLARILVDNNFRKNQKVSLELNDNAVHILPLP